MYIYLYIICNILYVSKIYCLYIGFSFHKFVNELFNSRLIDRLLIDLLYVIYRLIDFYNIQLKIYYRLKTYDVSLGSEKGVVSDYCRIKVSKKEDSC